VQFIPVTPRPLATFFFPYHEVSGVPVLFSRMARELASRGIPVRVIDYADGYQTRMLRGTANVELTAFRDGEPVGVSGDETLVMQSILPSTIRPELQPDESTRVFFWTLHPMNLVQTLVPTRSGRDLQARHADWNRRVLNTVLRGHRDAMRSLVSAMHARSAIAFMDGTTLDSTTRRLGMQIADPLMLPVPVEMAPGRLRTSPVSPAGELNVAWLGRLSDFKIHILTYTMTRLSRFAKERGVRIRFHVIGDGPDAGYVRFANVDHERFERVYETRLQGSALDDYLASRIDLLAAMGTSALEGARLGIPTILLDVAYGPIRHDYQYRWLFESERFSLGEMIGPGSFVPGNRSLEERVEALASSFTSLSSRTYDYCASHHALAAIADGVERAIPRARFRWADFSANVLRKAAARRVFEWWRSRRSPPAKAIP
jgi:hypothetical protein